MHMLRLNVKMKSYFNEPSSLKIMRGNNPHILYYNVEEQAAFLSR